MLAATLALTVIAEIDPARRALLDDRLTAIQADHMGNHVFRPGDLPDTHFMRFVIVDDARGELPALLVWETNHDGWPADYLASVARAVPSINRIFDCCVDYPAAGTDELDHWVAWMQRHSKPSGAFYTAYRGVPRSSVVNDRLVHHAIRDLLDNKSPCPRDCRGHCKDRQLLCATPPAEIQRWLCERIAAEKPDLDLSPTGDQEARWAIGKLLAILLGLAALPFALVGALPWWIILRRKESTDLSSSYIRPVDLDPTVRAIEDLRPQNQLTHVVDIKPGVFRLVTVWLVLKLIDILAHVYSVRGNLGGVTAIHFARWVIVRDRRPRRDAGGNRLYRRRHRLLFFSNFDGSWDSYLGEFIDRAAGFLTAVWSNTVGFPATEHLALGGARDEDAFKQWTREHQIATQVWWTGAPDSTAQNIRDDVWIRQRLDRGLSDRELFDWLTKL